MALTNFMTECKLNVLTNECKQMFDSSRFTGIGIGYRIIRSLFVYFHFIHDYHSHITTASHLTRYPNPRSKYLSKEYKT